MLQSTQLCCLLRSRLQLFPLQIPHMFLRFPHLFLRLLTPQKLLRPLPLRFPHRLLRLLTPQKLPPPIPVPCPHRLLHLLSPRKLPRPLPLQRQHRGRQWCLHCYLLRCLPPIFQSRSLLRSTLGRVLLWCPQWLTAQLFPLLYRHSEFLLQDCPQMLRSSPNRNPQRLPML